MIARIWSRQFSLYNPYTYNSMFNQRRLLWNGLHPLRKTCVMVLKSLCILWHAKQKGPQGPFSLTYNAFSVILYAKDVNTAWATNKPNLSIQNVDIKMMWLWLGKSKLPRQRIYPELYLVETSDSHTEWPSVMPWTVATHSVICVAIHARHTRTDSQHKKNACSKT